MKLSSRSIFVMLIFITQLANADQDCFYQTESGQIRNARDLQAVPERYRYSARCSTKKEQVLAAPQEIELRGAVREEVISSNLGTVHLRWPRKVETLFGRTPQRAVSDAITTASKVLRANSFPDQVQSIRNDWQIVFLDEELPTAQIPTALVSNCHPAWMTPPANLYIVGQRVIAGCGSGANRVERKVADAQLAQVLLHEIGHAIESKMLADKMDGDRVRAEGFACWFEQFAADSSSVIPKGSTKNYYMNLARSALQNSAANRQFIGTAEDYAIASLVFHAVVEKRGVSALSNIYQGMVSTRRPFALSLKESLGWDDKRLAKEIGSLFR